MTGLPAAVALRDATLALGGRVVLAHVDVAIAPGEFVGVLGPNGAGKTTLLRAILGLVPVPRGTVAVFGETPRRGNPAVGYMPQRRADFDGGGLRGGDLVAAAVNGHRYGLPFAGAATRAAVARALDMVGAADLARRPLMTLSGGERQRLLLAQALVGRPRLLLLDEPLAGLDPHRQHAIVALVGRLRRELGIAVLLSAHELNPLLGAIDRVLYLGGGHAAIGTVEQVITPPVLTRLYGAPMEVVRAGRRIFVVPGDA